MRYRQRPSVEHPPARGTSRCAPGAFSLTAMFFRSPRAQKGAWCARRRAGRADGGRRAQEAASGDWCGSAARLSDGSRRGGKRRQPGWRKAGKGRGTGRKGARAKKRSRGEKTSKKCSNMAKRAQIASLAISRGGAKRLYLRRAEHLGHRSIALRRRRRRRRRRGEARRD